MHRVSTLTSDESIESEGQQRRLWCWMVMCDDNTILTLHEDTGSVSNVEDLKSMRGNTLSVFCQVSKHGHLSANPISMQTVRQALEQEPPGADTHPGVEGASNLFYYLFDDWGAVYATINAYGHRLKVLQTSILHDLTRRSGTAPNIEIIPRLHILGQQIRQMQHLYEGYQNLIDRLLESKSLVASGHSMSGAVTSLARARSVLLAATARQRFERLRDRLQLLVLSEFQEFLTEKDALISTYFNINAQKDSESAARLTRAATLLAKLSVLFLPVSLVTSYFSIQISDLQGKYTSQDYWNTFAVTICISFAFLFFFSRLLMWCTETLDEWVKIVSRVCTRWFWARTRRRDQEKAGV